MSIVATPKGIFKHPTYTSVLYLTRNRLSVYNPANGELVSDKIPVAGEVDVDCAVQAAEKAFGPDSEWRKMNDFGRQKLLLRFADLIEENREYLASLTRITLGAPFTPFGKSEVDTAIGCFRCESETGQPSLFTFLTYSGQIMLAGSVSSRAKASQVPTDSTRL